ncbi:hypothetical protein J6590_069029 [Homalodisca vitripennis]|nr:hypothetical protein J6590_069029 [Homalodisca vitripennis]
MRGIGTTRSPEDHPTVVHSPRNALAAAWQAAIGCLVLESLHRCARSSAARLPASPATAAPACASHSSTPCLPAAALDSTSSMQPPLTAPRPHPVGAYSETAAQELTTNGIVRVSVLDAAISDHRAQVVEVIGCSPDVEGEAPKILRLIRQQNIEQLREFSRG